VPNTVFGTFYGPSPNAVEALGRDSSGAELFAVLRSEPTTLLPSGQFGEIDIVRVSGATGSVLASYQGLSTSMGVLSAQGHELIVGTSDGNAIVLQLKGTTLTALSSHSVATASVDAIQAGGDGQVWIVSAQRAECVSAKGQVLWRSTDNGYTAPAGLAIDASNEEQARLWVSSVWRVDGYQVGDFDRD
jgi:ligand-binding sensor domain-containing protein